MSARDSGLEQAAIDYFYRTEREWRVIGCWSSCLGAAAIYVGWRASGLVLMALSILCQAVSWRAMRGAERLAKKRIAQL